MFPKLLDAKGIAGVFVGPQVSWMFVSENKMTQKKVPGLLVPDF